MEKTKAALGQPVLVQIINTSTGAALCARRKIGVEMYNHVFHAFLDMANFHIRQASLRIHLFKNRKHPEQTIPQTQEGTRCNSQRIPLIFNATSFAAAQGSSLPRDSVHAGLAQ
ncbi:hypothetical protein [Thalassospira australica]|uniref:hypothetical protein n=1 Tax=Thalassospira australica TaxID=1528106 RepID=UPI0012E07675|nr:hypothetical protein [Thalassospira australica]